MASLRSSLGAAAVGLVACGGVEAPPVAPVEVIATPAATVAPAPTTSPAPPAASVARCDALEPPGPTPAPGSPEAEAAAECALVAVDRRLRADPVHDAGRRYTGAIDKVLLAYADDLKKAERYAAELEAVVTRFASPRAIVAARTRQGALYDACRTRLAGAREGELELYTDRERQFLAPPEEVSS